MIQLAYLMMTLIFSRLIRSAVSPVTPGVNARHGLKTGVFGYHCMTN
jgi:hypothetical protein